MDIIEAIYTRRAVRQFTAEPVDDQMVRRLVDAAIQAPSAINRQPWSFSIVRDKALLARMSREAKAHMLGTLQVASDPHDFRTILSNPDFDIFYDAPALILISAIDASAWATADCSLAAENLMLAAHAVGLGTCWIGLSQGWLGTPEGKAALNLPEAYMPIAPIIVGHPASPPPPVPRKEPRIRWIGS